MLINSILCFIVGVASALIVNDRVQSLGCALILCSIILAVRLPVKGST